MWHQSRGQQTANVKITIHRWSSMKRFRCFNMTLPFGWQRINCKVPQATENLVLFLTSSKQTLSKAINNCVQLISVMLCPLDGWTLHSVLLEHLRWRCHKLNFKLLIFHKHNIQLTTLPFFVLFYFLIKKRLLCHLSLVWHNVPIPITPASISNFWRSDYIEIAIVLVKEKSNFFFE